MMAFLSFIVHRRRERSLGGRSSPIFARAMKRAIIGLQLLKDFSERGKRIPMDTEHVHHHLSTTEHEADVQPERSEQPVRAHTEGAEGSPDPTSNAAPSTTSDEPPPPPTTEEEAPVSDPHPMEELSDESLELKRFHRGQMVEGTIIAKTDRELIIDIGGKSEGIVPADDLSLLDPEVLEKLTVGQRTVAYVLNPETPEGHVLLSLSRAQVEHDWRRVQQWQEEGRTIEARVVDVNRGGVVVRVGQLRGFIPASHLERRSDLPRTENPEQRFSPLKGQTLKVKVLEVDRQRRRLVLSEKEAVQEEREKARAELLASLKEGDVRRGRVKSLTNFGAFVDLGGIDGLIHISELSWKHVKHPSEVLQVGDEVEVYVLNVDREKERIGLSLRRMQPEPWETVLERYAIGQVVEGEVTKIMPYGAFVRLEDGIEGLVHVSELADRYVSHPHEVVREGDRVQVRILSIDPQSRRIGLSIKQASEEAYVEVDWEEAEPEEVTVADITDVTPTAITASEDISPAAVDSDDHADSSPHSEVIQEPPTDVDTNPYEPS